MDSARRRSKWLMPRKISKNPTTSNVFTDTNSIGSNKLPKNWAKTFIQSKHSLIYHFRQKLSVKYELIIITCMSALVFFFFLHPVNFSTFSLRNHRQNASYKEKLITEIQPRVVSLINTEPSTQSVIRLNVYAPKYPTKRKGFISKSSDHRQRKIKNSKRYFKTEKEAFVTETCKPMDEWQISSFPSCNKLHELSLIDELTHDTFIRIINNGYFRDVWTINDSDLERTPRVLKTLRYEHSYIDRNYDRHRRDAVAMERLTSSPYIVDIFGYCGNNGFFEYSNGGDIDHALFTKAAVKKPLIKYDRLRIAAQIAKGIADAHFVDEKGRATIAHTDITGGQFIYIDGIFKLNDFNRARFMRWSEEKQEPCGFRVAANRGDFRAPEEYEYSIESEKVDVYSMGNIFYQLITLNYYLFQDEKDEDVIQEKVKKGERPPYKEKIGDNPDAIDKVFLEAIEMCYTHNQTARPSAKNVSDFLFAKLDTIPYPHSNLNP